MQTVYLAAQRKSQALGESVQGFTVEAGKLSQRLASAETQYLDGLRKVKATNRQLQSLAKEIASSEKAAQRKPHCRLLYCFCIISWAGAGHIPCHLEFGLAQTSVYAIQQCYHHSCFCTQHCSTLAINQNLLYTAGLIRTLKELPSAEAIALRAEVRHQCF